MELENLMDYNEPCFYLTLSDRNRTNKYIISVLTLPFPQREKVKFYVKFKRTITWNTLTPFYNTIQHKLGTLLQIVF